MPNWWESSDKAPNGPMGEENRAGELGQGWRDGLGIGFTTIAEGGLFPFFLSSVYTARNYGWQDQQEVEFDILWSFVLSVIVSVILAYYLRSTITFLWGVAFGAVLSALYMVRGGFWKLPFHVPMLTPKPNTQ